MASFAQKSPQTNLNLQNTLLIIGILRGITIQELREAIANGEVIEDYPQDKYGPSCLVFGKTKSNRPIHIQCSHASRDIIKIIVLYQPDPEQWIDYRVRRE